MGWEGTTAAVGHGREGGGKRGEDEGGAVSLKIRVVWRQPAAHRFLCAAQSKSVRTKRTIQVSSSMHPMQNPSQGKVGYKEKN